MEPRRLTYEKSRGLYTAAGFRADYVTALGIQCSLDNVLITGGAQQALDLVVQALLSEGETLVTANPTYLGIYRHRPCPAYSYSRYRHG